MGYIDNINLISRNLYILENFKINPPYFSKISGQLIKKVSSVFRFTLDTFFSPP